jgi:hypothetical protein
MSPGYAEGGAVPIYPFSVVMKNGPFKLSSTLNRKMHVCFFSSLSHKRLTSSVKAMPWVRRTQHKNANPNCPLPAVRMLWMALAMWPPVEYVRRSKNIFASLGGLQDHL